MGTLIQFAPSTTQVFTFQPSLDGTLYNATVTQNVFGQRFYLNLTDLSGDLLLTCTIDGDSGPSMQATLSWSENGGALAVTAIPHLVPIGVPANLRISQTGTTFDGLWQALAITSTAFTYALSNPNESLPISGNLDFPANLVNGVVSGQLYFHPDTQQFEYS